MTKTRVALVLSGGVSAGAYIAGALDEILRAFAASDTYEIDVIVGASAGATNAAAIAQGLLYRDGETMLHDMWVKEVDIVELLAPDIKKGDPFSILSAGQIRKMGRDMIDWPADKPATRAAFCADDLTVAMTIANSTPLPYASRVRQPSANAPETFVQDRHAEQESYRLGAGVGPRDPIWERISMVAQASAALPLIFPMVQLTRQADGPGQYILPPSFKGERTFWYYDGGTYNNLPIDLAWHFVKQKAEREDADPLEHRKILVVNPWRNDTTPPADDPAYPGALTQLLNVVRDMHTESRTIQFDREILEPSLAATSGDDLSFALPGVDRPPVELLDRFALVIPRVGDPPLRCVYFQALSAFLDRRFREHDYRRGAADARRAAKQVLGIADYAEQDEAYYQPDRDAGEQDIRQYASLRTVKSSRADARGRSVQEVFEEALAERISAIVKTWDLPSGFFGVAEKVVTEVMTSKVLEKLPGMW